MLASSNVKRHQRHLQWYLQCFWKTGGCTRTSSHRNQNFHSQNIQVIWSEKKQNIQRSPLYFFWGDNQFANNCIRQRTYESSVTQHSNQDQPPYTIMGKTRVKSIIKYQTQNHQLYCSSSKWIFIGRFFYKSVYLYTICQPRRRSQIYHLLNYKKPAFDSAKNQLKSFSDY